MSLGTNTISGILDGSNIFGDVDAIEYIVPTGLSLTSLILNLTGDLGTYGTVTIRSYSDYPDPYDYAFSLPYTSANLLPSPLGPGTHNLEVGLGCFNPDPNNPGIFCDPTSGIDWSISALTVATPIPAALPLFASGCGAFGLFGWRRKRKAQAAA